jgi:D-alanine-D-alanine ligase
MPHERCLQIPEADKDSLRLLFLAKHALSDGSPDALDGTHATYHHELRSTLEAIGLNVTAANDFSALLSPTAFDFAVSLYNRAGFRASEMLAPLLCEWQRVPFMGGAPVVRGLTDDKHRMKQVARSLGIRTPDWAYYPIGGLDLSEPRFSWDRLIVKPNASSASWGIRDFDSWSAARAHVVKLQEEGHDAIVEAYIPGFDIAASVVGSIRPWYLPIIRYRNEGSEVRTYEEKRNLVPSATEHVVLFEPELVAKVRGSCEAIVNDLWPFDHGRLEFRVHEQTGEIYFIEINVNCNLWSQKTIATAARCIGVCHQELIETIVCHSMMRQGVLARKQVRAA